MISYRTHTDEDLFALLKNDDEKAFTELYDRYWKKLFVRARLLLNSQEDAEDLVHDVFVKLWRKRATLHIFYSFHTYVAAMLRYGCFKELAQRKKRREKEALLEEIETADYSTQQWLEFEQLQEELEAAVGELPDRCRVIFRLSREKYLTDKEIAQKLDISVNTVRTQMYRALKKLKVSLHTFFIL